MLVHFFTPPINRSTGAMFLFLGSPKGFLVRVTQKEMCVLGTRVELFTVVI